MTWRKIKCDATWIIDVSMFHPDAMRGRIDWVVRGEMNDCHLPGRSGCAQTANETEEDRDREAGGGVCAAIPVGTVAISLWRGFMCRYLHSAVHHAHDSSPRAEKAFNQSR